MRHGVGPFSSNHDFKDDTVNTLSADLGSLAVTDRDGRQRLGCYFCNDVVAPIDVNSEIAKDLIH